MLARCNFHASLKAYIHKVRYYKGYTFLFNGIGKIAQCLGNISFRALRFKLDNSRIICKMCDLPFFGGMNFSTNIREEYTPILSLF